MTLHDYFGRVVSVDPWDGKTLGGRCYDNADGLYIDAAGNIWYILQDGSGRAAIWCVASRLDQHIHNLHQIAAQ